MRRREFVAGLAIAGVAFVSWPAWAGRLLGVGTACPADRLLAGFRQPDSAAAVGRAYLAGHPQSADIERLAGTVTTRLERQGCNPARASRADLRAAISRQVRDDFARGRVVDVDGWVLSATEAELCGLAALARA